MDIRVHVLISGRVQGVFYRASTRDRAEQYGLTGWVRNTSDGTVEVVAEGEKEALERFYAWCPVGPSFSQVKKIEAKWEPYRGEFEEFIVEN